MPDPDAFELEFAKRRYAAEREAAVAAVDTCASRAHGALASLYGDRVVSARRSIDAQAAQLMAARAAQSIDARGVGRVEPAARVETWAAGRAMASAMHTVR